jgi:hypothetical protein
VEGSCEHGSIKCWEVFEWLQNWLLKKGSAPEVSKEGSVADQLVLSIPVINNAMFTSYC